LKPSILVGDAANVAGDYKVRRILQKTKRFLASEDGPTAVEYAVMLALIVGVCLASVNALANATGSSFDKSAAAILAP
jgi:pilus assembly protein Flp/PilA